MTAVVDIYRYRYFNDENERSARMKQLAEGEWITTGEAAVLLNVDEKTIRNWIGTNQIIGSKVGRNYIVLKSSLKGKSKDGRGRKVKNSKKAKP